MVSTGAVVTPGRSGPGVRRGRIATIGRVVAVGPENSGPCAAESRSGDRPDGDDKE
jgi:hypothetical protein